MRDDPEVILHKRIKADGKPGKTIPSKLRRGVLNWEPPYKGEGEAKVSMRRDKEALEAEWKRRNPTKEKLRRE